MAGFDNEVVYGTNVDFRGQQTVEPQVLNSGELLIGSDDAPHIRVNTLTAGPGVVISNGQGSITIGLTGAGVGIDSIGVQTGTSPIAPTGAGLVTINGAVTAAGTNPVRTDGTGANTMAVEVQISQAIAAADATKIGLSNFDSSMFTVAATGFVQLGVVPVANGGTGSTGITGIVAGTGSAYNGRTITAGTGISVSNGNGSAGNPTINAVGGGVTWSVVTVDASMTVNTGTIANKAGLLTMTLPATSAVGDIVSITGINTALGWKIGQNAGNQIFFGTSSTTSGTGGSLASINTRDTVTLVCVTANAAWNVISSIGNLTVV